MKLKMHLSFVRDILDLWLVFRPASTGDSNQIFHDSVAHITMIVDTT